ncbi:MAG: aminopeptidase P family protein [Clostridia bacterium]|nr:aminopeptidase P family protein [Clostridia bacterium]
MKVTNAQKIFNAVGAQAVLTEQADLRQYLTGISTTFGYVLSDKNGNTFYTDSRYLEAASAALDGTDIKVKQFQSPLANLLKGYKEVAVPLSRTSYPEYKRLEDLGLKIVDSEKAFIDAMSIKQQYELDLIQKACNVTDDAFVALLGRIKEGMSENEVAAELEYLMRCYGASGTSFDTIVAFGKNSSVPHHETGDTKLKYGDIILIDFGCKVGGYCSDCTRTFLFGNDNKHGDFIKAYDHVLKAHMLVKEQVTDGITGREADAVARDYLKRYGLDKYFTHSLGHGIGVNIHEYPYLSPKGENVLKNGMVFSDEPGVYFEGDFGIRIEDTVTLKDGKVISLTNSNKNLTVI